MPKSTLKHIAALVLTVLSAINAQAQTSATDQTTPSALAKGSHPLGSYGGSSFDKVNLFNGNLSFSIPLASLGGRAGLGVSVVLSYNSKIWRVERFETANGPVFLPAYDDWDSFIPQLAPGWTIQAGRMAARQSGYGSVPCPDPSNPTLKVNKWSRTITHFTFTAPDGTEYEFRDDARDGEPLPLNECGPASRGSVFHSTDGTAATFISHNLDGSPKEIFDYDGEADASPRMLYAAGTVALRDGSRFLVVDGVVREQKDRNGNIVRFTYEGSRLTSVADTLGRVIAIQYFDGASSILARVSFKGTGGAPRTIEVLGAALATALRSGQTPLSLSQLFPNLDATNPESFNPTVVSSITLPDGPNGRKWNFLYNSYGEVSHVETPALGVIEYEAGEGQGPYPPAVGPQIFRRTTQRRAYASASSLTTPELTTSYGDPSLKNADGSSAPVAQDHIGPEGRLEMTKHQFVGSPLDNYDRQYGAPAKSGYKPWMEGKETRVAEIDVDGTTEKRAANYTWAQRAAVSWITTDPSFADQPENDPRLIRIKTVLKDTQQASEIENDYDRYNNLTAERVYDFGAEGANQRGGLLRETTRSYVSNLTVGGQTRNYQTNLNIHIRSLVDAETVKGAVVETQTKFEYDDYSANALIDLAFAGSASAGRDPNYTSAYLFRGNLTAITTGQGSPEASSIRLQYDIAGNAVKTIGPLSNQIAETDFDTTHYAFPIRTRQNANGFAFAASGSYDFDTGALLSTTGFNGDLTSYGYADALDRLTSATPPSGFGQTRYAYSPANIYPLWVRSETDFQLSSNIKLTSLTEFDGLLKALEQTRNDAGGDVTAESRYDGLGRARLVSNPHRSTAATTDGWTSTTFDGLGRVTRAASCSNESMTAGCTGEVTSSYIGNQVTVTDQQGKKRKSLTDALGRLVKVYEPDVSGGLTFETSYSYDARGNLKQVLQGGQTRTFTYDSLGRLRQAQTPESGTIIYAYDAASNLTSRTDVRSVITNYTYDELNRVRTKTYSGSTPQVKYYYDDESTIPASERPSGFDAGFSMGRLIGVTTISGGQIETGIFHRYDVGGRVTQSIQVLDGTSYASAVAYNEGSAPASETYPSNVDISNAYNSSGQISSVSRNGLALANDFSYTAAGTVSRQRLGNSLHHAINYNNRLQPTAISLGASAGASDKLRLDYDYGMWNPNNGANSALNPVLDQTKNNGNLGRVVIAAGVGSTAMTQEYAYDEMNRISLAREYASSAATWSQQFQYDRYGNKTCCSPMAGAAQGTSIPISQADNRISAPGYVYDAAGNLKQESNGNAYDYDAENRMTRATVGGAVTNYVYDGNGRRVKKVVDGATTKFVYDGSDKLIAEYGAGTTAATPDKEYVYGATGLLVIVETVECGTSKVLKYVTPDHLGTPRVVTDLKGRALSRHDYFPFGEEIPLSMGSRASIVGYNFDDKVRQKFTGYERDDETGLDFAQARYFASSLGRFNSVDPGGVGAITIDPQSWNGYAYGLNNPLKFVDPDGLKVKIADLDGASIEISNADFNKRFKKNKDIILDGGKIFLKGQQIGTFKPLGPDDLSPFALGVISELGRSADASNKLIAGFAGMTASGGYSVGTGGGALFLNAIGETLVLINTTKEQLEAQAVIASTTEYTDTTKGKSVRNVQTDITPDEFGKNLEANGYTKIVRPDGKIIRYVKGNFEYSVYAKASSTGGPSVQVKVNGFVTTKIRLK